MEASGATVSCPGSIRTAIWESTTTHAIDIAFYQNANEGIPAEVEAIEEAKRKIEARRNRYSAKTRLP
jgi:hypothetical protein